MVLTEGYVIANRYKLLERLGGGSFSEVWKANDIVFGPDTMFALKIYNTGADMNSSDYAMFVKEFKLMCNLDHHNLLTPKYYEQWNDITFLVLKYCAEGSCEKLIGKFDEQQAVRFLHDVASGLMYLHNQKSPIIHQDIKPDNILIDDDGFIITDFGVSTDIKKTVIKGNIDNVNAGTVSYFAPERFDKTYIPITASDIWSLGASVFELITGDCPFGNDGGITQQNDNIPDLPKKYNKNLNKLIKLCLSKEPWNRPKAEDIVEITNNYLEHNTWKLSNRHGQSNIKKAMKVVKWLFGVLVFVLIAFVSIHYYTKYETNKKMTEVSQFIDMGDKLYNVSSKDHKKYIDEIMQCMMYYDKAYKLKQKYNDTTDIQLLLKKINNADSIRIEKFNHQIKGAKMYLNVNDEEYKYKASEYISNAKKLAVTNQEINVIKKLNNE